MSSTVMKKPGVELKSKAELKSMRKAGEIAGKALREVGKAIRPGIATRELDRIAEEFIRGHNAKPTFVGYRGYPSTICVSINEEVVHGMPGDRKINPGDIVSIDVAATVDGFVGDTATTWIVPPVAPEAERLVSVTKKSLDAGIEMMRPGKRLGDVSRAVQDVIENAGFGVVREFVGHGIGRQMHEEPPVPNYGAAGTGLRLEPGLVLAIEPMVTAGSFKVRVLKDGWTVVTEDGSMAAHFEHSIAVTEDGPWVLTRIDD